MAKKGFIARMIEGPERSESYARSTLPTNRWSLGWDVFKTNKAVRVESSYSFMLSSVDSDIHMVLYVQDGICGSATVCAEFDRVSRIPAIRRSRGSRN